MNTSPWPFHDDDEIQAVHNVLSSGRTNYWTGTECREFEKEYAEAVGTQFAVALMNGTVALEAALCSLDVGPGDEVITSCRTFIASASAIVMRGAIPVLADVDVESQNITADTIACCITEKTKAIIVVHLAGWPADMPAILQLAKKHHLKVIEDCAQAHGAMINDKQVGSWGDIGCFSFCQDKIITTGGEGGMITTNDPVIWKKIWSLKDHGKNHDKVYRQEHPPGYRWLHDSFGTNWRMTEIQAVIGRLQLRKLTQWIQIRNRNANILTEHLQNVSAIRIPRANSNIQHAYYKYYIFLNENDLKPEWNRDKIMQEINAAGVPCFVGSCSDIQHEKAFAGIDYRVARPNAKLLGDTSLMFLVHPTLTVSNMRKMADDILQIFETARSNLIT